MRPRKHILLVSENDDAISALRYVLNNQPSYRVTTALSTVEALLALKEHEYRLMLVKVPIASLAELMRQARLINQWMPKIILASKSESIIEPFADAVFYDPSVAELLQRVKVWTARKRGPKRGYKKIPQPEWFQVNAKEVVA